MSELLKEIRADRVKQLRQLDLYLYKYEFKIKEQLGGDDILEQLSITSLCEELQDAKKPLTGHEVRCLLQVLKAPERRMLIDAIQEQLGHMVCSFSDFSRWFSYLEQAEKQIVLDKMEESFPKVIESAYQFKHCARILHDGRVLHWERLFLIMQPYLCMFLDAESDLAHVEEAISYLTPEQRQRVCDGFSVTQSDERVQKLITMMQTPRPAHPTMQPFKT